MTLLQAYMEDPVVRKDLNTQGLYINQLSEHGATTLTFYITDEIHHSDRYHDFCELAVLLDDTDYINLIIDSPGGRLSGANLILTAIHSSSATSTAIVTDCAASAATIIALACDELIMTDHSSFMIHAVAFGSGGKLHEVASHTEFTLRKSKDLIKEVYKHFLTDEEIEEVIQGRDIWLDENETMERWSKVQDARTAEYEAEEQEHLQAHIDAVESQLQSLKDKLPKAVVEAKTKRTKKVS